MVALLLASGVLFNTRSANAQAISCHNVSGTSSWPYNGYTQYCGSATNSDGGNVAGVLQGILNNDSSGGTAGNRAGDILSSYVSLGGTGAHFFVFGTQSEFSNGGGTGYCNVNPGVFGYSKSSDCPTFATNSSTVTKAVGNTGNPQYTVIFSRPGGNPVSNLNNLAVHEAGHWLDYSAKWKTLLGTSGLRASDSTEFNSEFNQDWTNLNNLPGCSTPAPSVFTGFADSNNHWICNNNGRGSGFYSPYGPPLTVKGDLQKAWPTFFDPNNFNPATNKEFFAEVAAFVTGNIQTGPASPDNFFNGPQGNQFSCTQRLVDSLMRYGQVPGRTGSVLSWPPSQGCPKI